MLVFESFQAPVNQFLLILFPSTQLSDLNWRNDMCVELALCEENVKVSKFWIQVWWKDHSSGCGRRHLIRLLN